MVRKIPTVVRWICADNLPYEKVGKNEPVCIADEVPFDIPDSWEWARLGMISTYSHTKQKINAKNADPQMWGLDLEDIEKGGRLLERKTVGERKAVGDKTFFDSGDILYSKLRPYLLKILVAPDCGICTPEIVPFKVFGKINPEYIVAFLKSPYLDVVINSVTYGVKMPRVGTETMTGLLVPLPPLSEQKRIVEKLSEVIPLTNSYAKVYVRAAELNQEFPELLKKSILQEAVQGKLVPQDPADEPASVLLEHIRAEKAKLLKEGKIKKDKHESVIFRRDNSHYEKHASEEVCIDDKLPFEIPKIRPRSIHPAGELQDKYLFIWKVQIKMQNRAIHSAMVRFLPGTADQATILRTNRLQKISLFRFSIRKKEKSLQSILEKMDTW